jgi:hypothetical protein
MNALKLFLVCVILGGLFAALGSMLGARFGHTGLMAGGVLGGVLGSIAAVRVAQRRSWISNRQFTGASIGAAAGFVASAFVATHTLSSPIGPVLSTALIGLGAIAGARLVSTSNE